MLPKCCPYKQLCQEKSSILDLCSHKSSKLDKNSLPKNWPRPVQLYYQILLLKWITGLICYLLIGVWNWIKKLEINFCLWQNKQASSNTQLFWTYSPWPFRKIIFQKFAPITKLRDCVFLSRGWEQWDREKYRYIHREISKIKCIWGKKEAIYLFAQMKYFLSQMKLPQPCL